jgi:1,4-dihydroxy-6-naphthoate synthase
VRLTLGISPCPNDVYIFAAILLGEVASEGIDFDVRYEDVETLNRLAQSGALDVAKISYANYVRCAEAYRLLGCGGALGRGVGPLLLANGGRFDAEAVVLVPGEFTTANFLLDYYLARPVRKRYLPFDALYEELLAAPAAQGVVIHEKRFTYERDELTLVRDLGEHWEMTTGYPIPLGGIVARKELGLAEPLEALIRRSLDWSDSHDDRAFALCREHAQDLDPAVVRAHIDLYVNEYSRDLGPQGHAAVGYFLDQQRKLAAPLR